MQTFMARKREALTPTTPLSPHYLAKRTLSKLKWSRQATHKEINFVA